MENQSDKENKHSPVFYIEPTTEELMRSVYQFNGHKFIGKCRLCRQQVLGNSIEELKEHKCQS